MPLIFDFGWGTQKHPNASEPNSAHHHTALRHALDFRFWMRYSKTAKRIGTRYPQTPRAKHLNAHLTAWAHFVKIRHGKRRCAALRVADKCLVLQRSICVAVTRGDKKICNPP